MGVIQDWVRIISGLISRILTVFGPSIPFIPQHIENRNTKNADGYSLYVSLLSIISACLKIALWLGQEYDSATLLQNFVTIFAVLVMIDQHISIENRRKNLGFDEHNFVDFDWTWFWQWTNFMSYVQATGYCLIMTLAVTVLLAWVPDYFDYLSFFIILIDSSVSTPQLWHNFTRKTTYGLNKSMVSMWNIYDVYKLIYMMTSTTPWPLKLNGVIQLLVDTGILAQIFYYGDRPLTRGLTVPTRAEATAIANTIVQAL